MPSQTLKDSAKLLSANVVAQVVGFLFYPLLTRLYSAQDFGILNLFLSIGGVLVLCATAEYQYAVMLPKAEKKAVSVFQVSALIVLGVTLLCGISVFFRRSIASFFNAPELAAFYPFMPLFVFFSAAWNLFNYWFTRHSRFGTVAAYQITRNLSNSLLKYGAGRAGWLRWGLLGSTLFGVFLPLVAAILPDKAVCKPLLRFNKSDVRQAARRYVRFPLFSLPRALVNNVSCNLPIFMLTPFFGLKELGYFGMGHTLAYQPVSIMAASFCQVFYQKMSASVRERKPILPFFRKVLVRGGLSVALTFPVLYFVLPSLTVWLLGADWETTGHYIRLMLPWLALTAISGCIAFISDLFQRQASMLVIETVYFALRAVALLVGILFGDFRLAILLYSLVSAFVILFQVCWFFGLVKRYERSITAQRRM